MENKQKDYLVLKDKHIKPVGTKLTTVTSFKEYINDLKNKTPQIIVTEISDAYHN